LPERRISELLEAAAQASAFPVLLLPTDAVAADVERAVIGSLWIATARCSGAPVRCISADPNALDNASTHEMTQELARSAGRVVYLENEYGVLQAVASPPVGRRPAFPRRTSPGALFVGEVLGISAGALQQRSRPAA